MRAYATGATAGVMLAEPVSVKTVTARWRMLKRDLIIGIGNCGTFCSGLADAKAANTSAQLRMRFLESILIDGVVRGDKTLKDS